jgi:hypothetical protein
MHKAYYRVVREELGFSARRAGIEPVIGHLKSDGHLGRNFLAGASGDAINVVLAAAGHNLRLLRAWLIRLLAFLISLIAISGPGSCPWAFSNPGRQA